MGCARCLVSRVLGGRNDFDLRVWFGLLLVGNILDIAFWAWRCGWCVLVCLVVELVFDSHVLGGL